MLKQRIRAFAALTAVFASAYMVAGDGLVQMNAKAQNAYPAKTVTVIVPFSAGGRTDLTARSVVEGLQEHLGGNVVVINKSGAGGVVGSRQVAAAAPDGYTAGIFSSAVVSAQYTVKDGTDLADYKIAGVVESSPAALAVRKDADWNSLSELVEYCKKNPGELKIGMIPGASAQVFAGGFADAAGCEATMVPFDSDAPGVAALAGQHIDAHVAVPASYKPLIEAGQIKVLGVAADERMTTFPDIPTMPEQGVDLVIGSFHALYLPKDTPEEILASLEDALGKAMKEEKVVERMANVGLGPLFMDREAGKAFLAKQDAAYKKLISSLGLMQASKQ